MLASDHQVMAPAESSSREIAAIYVGAGGKMLAHKPSLLPMLLAARPYGLALYGSYWDEVSELRDIWKGVLPQNDLAKAYSSAAVVLATTIFDQGAMGMINNRIFESLSCGAVVISDNWPVLQREFGDVLFLANTTEDVAAFIRYILDHPEEMEARRQRGRELVIRRHTWSHRVIDILNLFKHIYLSNRQVMQPSLSFSRPRDPYGSLPWTTRRPVHQIPSELPTHLCTRPQCPSLLFVVSEQLESHPDLVHMRDLLLPALAQHYNLHFSNQSYFTAHSSNATWLSLYRAMLVVCVPFDPLDSLVASLPPLPRIIAPEVNVTGWTQRRAALIIGVDESYVESARAATGLSMGRYEVIFYRDDVDLQMLVSMGVDLDPFRLQHLFGVGGALNTSGDVDSIWRDGDDRDMWTAHIPSMSTTSGDRNESVKGAGGGGVPRDEGGGEPGVMVLCFFHWARICTAAARKRLLAGAGNHTLVLLGGRLGDWLEIEDGYIVVDPDVTPLARTVHVPDGYKSNVLDLMRRSDGVYLMAGGFTSEERSNGQGAGAGSSGLVSRSTVQNVIWPVVACARFGLRVHLPVRNDHLIAVAQSNAEEWTEDYAMRAVGAGLARMTGFGSHSSRFTFAEDTEARPSLSREGVNLVHLDFHRFVLGEDGECCFVHREQTLGCYFRADVVVGLQVVISNGSCGVDDAGRIICASDYIDSSHNMERESVEVDAPGFVETKSASVEERDHGRGLLAHAHVNVTIELRGTMFKD
eukprot:gene1744-2045_t